MTPYLLMSADFVPTGGMDMPNLALATYLADRGVEVHLVTHRADKSLTIKPNVIVHHVPKPVDSYLLATPVFDRIGRRWASKIAARDGRIVVNGGNCLWGDVNWVHYVHASFRAPHSGSAMRLLKNECAHKTFLAYERAALRKARVVIANSERTRRDVIERLGVDGARVHTVYYGIDPEKFRPPPADERTRARQELKWSNGKPVVVFIGALGDRRKGFDKLFDAWKILCTDSSWNADLAVVGTGAELPAWKARATESGLQSRIRFLGFRSDVPMILAASDALVAPTRYEAYGQGVHEALCCGLPALVTKTAGVAERYPSELQDLLIPDPEDADDLASRLRAWSGRREAYRLGVESLSEELRARSWKDMAAQIVEVIEADGRVASRFKSADRETAVGRL